MYDIDPLTEEQIASAGLLEKGVYDFEVTKSERQLSKTGNPMCKLTLDVFDKEGKRHIIFDYLVFSKVPLNIKKVKHFCDTTKLEKEYQSGKIPEELTRRCGKVELDIQEKQPKPNGGFYAEKNIVVDYVMTNLGATKFESYQPDPRLNDDVPF